MYFKIITYEKKEKKNLPVLSGSNMFFSKKYIFIKIINCENSNVSIRNEDI